jgi:S-formylglutathione hydrolase FrmB
VRRLLACAPVLAATVALAVAAPAAEAAPAAAVPVFTAADGIQVSSQTALDPRLLALTVTTRALTGSADVRILLPAGYATQPRRRYPVLYLLHGTSGGAADWTTMGAAEQTTAGRPLIVVMPDIAQHDNGGGWCTDSYNGGAYGPPEWETFHIDQLIPWIDSNLRTVAGRQGRAIAGLSQGGFCSMSYAARHPDLFSAALSFSGRPTSPTTPRLRRSSPRSSTSPRPRSTAFPPTPCSGPGPRRRSTGLRMTRPPWPRTSAACAW